MIVERFSMQEEDIDEHTNAQVSCVNTYNQLLDHYVTYE
jgi:hypothetical protein